MSQWTHVAGIIRIDSLGGVIGPVPSEAYLTSAFDEGLPTGSEGPVRFTVAEIREPDTNSLSWGILAIHGDLRDYDDADAIEDWFQESCRRLTNTERMKEWHMSSMIREAVLSINVEYGENRLVRYEREGVPA